MRPLYQPQSSRQVQQIPFTPYSYSKTVEVKNQSSVPHLTNHTYGYQTTADTFVASNKKIDEQVEGGFGLGGNGASGVGIGRKIGNGGWDIAHLKKEQGQTDLRNTCSNVQRKYQQSTIRNTTNFTSKMGAVMADVKRYEEQEQKGMKKNGAPTFLENGGFPTSNTKIESSYKSKVADKKVLGQPNFKSLNELWSNKVSNSQKPKKNIINGFEIYKQLGKGKFGEVYLARHAETGFVVALKKIIKAKVIQYKMLEQFKREIRLHSALDHPNIVKFYGFFEDGDNIYLILEYISGGTLFDYLAEKDMLSPQEAAEYLKDSIQALSYMHDRSIAHRDIKPENIVLTAEKVAKLCDFGWSALVESSRTTYCGTFDYAPPEILERKNYDTAVDIWCIGVLTFELLTGRVPFEGEKRKQIMQKILSVDKTKINYPLDVPEQAKNFIQLLVQKDPNLRPKCKDLLKHPFFNNLRNVQNFKQRKV